jgi:hypothetical protein
MPRGRGGARQGTPGTAYGNRTDLNMPISTVPGQDYGKASQQQAAQSAVPMAASPVAPTQPVQSNQPVQQAQPLPRPGSMPYLDPTMRPNEPVTTGIDYGPGAGSEAMGPREPIIANNLVHEAQRTGSTALSDLAAFAVRMGL